ncbi:MAG: protein kinase [Pseudomonadota bacterium]|nr:protein kinase [Pseudomonadota bacterium]
MNDLFPASFKRVRPLGRGASARVWLAEGPSGLVAVKLASVPGGLRRELEAHRSVRHPYIAHIVQADPNGDWMAMEFAQNERADSWGRGQPMPVLVELGAQVAEALAHLHALGMVHGDLKPSNVLVAEDGTARLIDLGMARGRELPALDLGGTLGFIAPELLRGERPGPEADMYGLGVLLYHLLTRQAPFRDADPAALGYLPLTTLPEPPSSLRPRLPRALDDLVLGLLARRPASRPMPATRVAALLRASLSTPPRAPLVGMTREREILRRHVVDLLDGKPATLVLHGNAGSGRRTLIRECVRAAQREGVRVVPGGADRRALLAELGQGSPAILALDGNAPGVEPLVVRIITEQPLCLTLVRADRPLMKAARLGARHLCPPPLSPEDVARVLEGLEMDRRRAEEFHRLSRGSPGSLLGLALGLTVSDDSLEPIARQVIALLSTGPQTVTTLAERVGLSEHRLLDHVEPLIDRGLVTASGDGAWLMEARADNA